MKKPAFVFLAGLALASCALADLTKYKDWDKSPEAYFLTPSERAEWKKLTIDADAEQFVALYWARRGGEPFRQEVARRIALADQQFPLAHYKRGADSARGRLLVVFGTPSRVVRGEGAGQEPLEAGGLDARFADQSVVFTWIYEKDKLAALGLPELRARVAVDAGRGTDSIQNASDVEKAAAVAAEKSIVKAGAAAPAAKAAPAPAPTPVPAALPAPARSALAGAAGKTDEATSFWSGVFRSPVGDRFFAIQFYLPSDQPAFSAGTPLKLGAIVTDEGGKEVLAVWEDAAFSEVTEGPRKDRVVDRSILLPPGQYRGVFGLFASEAEPPVAIATAAFRLEPRSGDFGVSPLILANAYVPMTRRPGPTDPFVFGTDKPIKFEPKGDRRFLGSESLWYLYAVENPAAAAPPADAAPAADGAAPAPSKPRVMARISVQRDGKDAFRPSTAPADLVEIASGYFTAGGEIPLASFEPGYYTFAITVRDLNAPKESLAGVGLERKQDFVVLKPDGSLPDRPKPAAAPTPKPKKP